MIIIKKYYLLFLIITKSIIIFYFIIKKSKIFYKYSNLVKFPIDSGIGPFKLLLDNNLLFF